MSKNSSKVSSKNKQGILFWSKLTLKWILGWEFQKKILGLEFQKFESGFGISTCKIQCTPVFRQNERL